MANYTEHTDEELVALLKQGDRAAFAELYDRYSPKVLAQVDRMVREEEIAKDIVQELFLTVWLKAENIRPDVKIGGYLYVAAQNLVLKSMQRSKFENDYVQSLAKFSTELHNSTTELIDEKELDRLIRHYISQLPEKTRKIFELSRMSNLSYQEIATELDIAEQTVKNQVSIALKILRDKLAPHAPGAMVIIALLKKH